MNEIESMTNEIEGNQEKYNEWFIAMLEKHLPHLNQRSPEKNAKPSLTDRAGLFVNMLNGRFFK